MCKIDNDKAQPKVQGCMNNELYVKEEKLNWLKHPLNLTKAFGIIVLDC